VRAKPGSGPPGSRSSSAARNGSCGVNARARRSGRTWRCGRSADATERQSVGSSRCAAGRAPAAPAGRAPRRGRPARRPRGRWWSRAGRCGGGPSRARRPRAPCRPRAADRPVTRERRDRRARLRQRALQAAEIGSRRRRRRVGRGIGDGRAGRCERVNEREDERRERGPRRSERDPGGRRETVERAEFRREPDEHVRKPGRQRLGTRLEARRRRRDARALGGGGGASADPRRDAARVQIDLARGRPAATSASRTPAASTGDARSWRRGERLTFSRATPPRRHELSRASPAARPCSRRGPSSSAGPPRPSRRRPSRGRSPRSSRTSRARPSG
jgi:hypothetical protein